MSLTEKVLEIYQKYSLCQHCLGRMFALLGTNTTNLERAGSMLLTITMQRHAELISGVESLKQDALNHLKNLAFRANFSMAKAVLSKEGYDYDEITNGQSPCHLCKDLFDNLDKFVDKAVERSNELEFDTFLVGCSPDPSIINREDKFKAEFTLLKTEAFKSHFNRALGKNLGEVIKKEVDFTRPDIVFIFSLDYEKFSLDLQVRSLFVSGRYQKLIRGIPQTRWVCGKCKGKGCELCKHTGKKYPLSVEELIYPEFREAANAEDSKFHGAGREDIDVRMLGTGRPFILELQNPRVRSLDLEELMEKVNSNNPDKIKITDLEFSDKKEVIRIKEDAENTRKVYKALVGPEKEVSKEDFEIKLAELKSTFVKQAINQSTPNRVVHRRADLVREKMIHGIEGKFHSPKEFEFIIESQGGTYIKELIHGDEGRTKPSFADIFGMAMTCKELDVIKILS